MEKNGRRAHECEARKLPLYHAQRILSRGNFNKNLTPEIPILSILPIAILLGFCYTIIVPRENLERATGWQGLATSKRQIFSPCEVKSFA
jgi:hypothetical protein